MSRLARQLAGPPRRHIAQSSRSSSTHAATTRAQAQAQARTRTQRLAKARVRSDDRRGAASTIAAVCGLGLAGTLLLLNDSGRHVAWANGQADDSRANGETDDSLVDMSKLQSWNHNWDGRHHVKPRGRKTRYIILIRHGQYHSEERDDRKQVLTELGHKQAELLTQRLAEYPWIPTQITCSTLMRARQTTNHIQSCSKFMNIDNSVIDSKLKEGRPFQPVPPARVGIYFKSQVQRDGARIDAAFDSIFYRPGPDQLHNTYDVVVCHANVIRYFVCRALQIPKEAWLRMALPHCSITILAIRPTGYVSLKCLGESGFLPMDMVTTH